MENDGLAAVVDGLRRMNFAGFAVTKPNKVKVLDYLDELDPLCQKMGACNTVVKLADGRLKGYNTDGVGFWTSLNRETKLDAKASRFFCVGAGGAGRAVCSILAYNGAPKIYIFDADPAAARQLVDDINANFAPVAEFVDFDDKPAAYAIAQSCDALLNCSGLGMSLYQGAAQIELWSGCEAPVEAMRQELLAILAGQPERD